ncbi:MAG TPA: MBL fold metallo-hydrolase [Nevskiaceae bacterium]|nr:MBL fold metallo-hydrolase [Nevskiaceae bacterium]
MTALLLLVVVLATTVAAVLSTAPFGAPLDGERLARARANPLYQDGAFANPQPPAAYTFADLGPLLKGQFFGDEVRVPPAPIPVVPVDAAKLKAPLPAEGLRAFWIGHGSVYVEIDGVRLLIDPVFSEYASPFSIGPRRFHPPPIALADLPPIDAVLITHDHYDHLDMATVKTLSQRGASFVVPLGIGAHLARWGVPEARIHDLEWWQGHVIRDVKIVATPTRHYSGRGLSRNPTLWTSWAVIGPRHRIYDSGDTGYGDHFRAIGERLGPFDAAFVKVGAYGPGAGWLDIHMSAEDAVRAVQDVRAARLFPVHWGTFNLGFHAWDEPIHRTLAAARAGEVAVVTPRVGEIVDFDAGFQSQPWWEAVR